MTVQVLDVAEGMTLERLTFVPTGEHAHGKPTATAAYVRATVVSIRRFAPGSDAYVIEWSDGHTETYQPHHRFVRP